MFHLGRLGNDGDKAGETPWDEATSHAEWPRDKQLGRTNYSKSRID